MTIHKMQYIVSEDSHSLITQSPLEVIANVPLSGSYAPLHSVRIDGVDYQIDPTGVVTNTKSPLEKVIIDPVAGTTDHYNIPAGVNEIHVELRGDNVLGNHIFNFRVVSIPLEGPNEPPISPLQGFQAAILDQAGARPHSGSTRNTAVKYCWTAAGSRELILELTTGSGSWVLSRVYYIESKTVTIGTGGTGITPGHLSGRLNRTQIPVDVLYQGDQFSGNYNDLTNAPSIPSTFNDLSGTVNDNDLSPNIARTSQLFSGDYGDLTNRPVLFSGDYNDLVNRPSIPGTFSHLTGVIDDSQIPASIARDSELINYVTVRLNNVAGDLTYTEKQSFRNKIGVNLPLNYNDLTNKPNIPDSFSDLPGQILDSQIPSSIARDSEVRNEIDGLRLQSIDGLLRDDQIPINVREPTYADLNPRGGRIGWPNAPVGTASETWVTQTLSQLTHGSQLVPGLAHRSPNHAFTILWSNDDSAGTPTLQWTGGDQFANTSSNASWETIRGNNSAKVAVQETSRSINLSSSLSYDYNYKPYTVQDQWLLTYFNHDGTTFNRTNLANQTHVYSFAVRDSSTSAGDFSNVYPLINQPDKPQLLRKISNIAPIDSIHRINQAPITTASYRWPIDLQYYDELHFAVTPFGSYDADWNELAIQDTLTGVLRNVEINQWYYLTYDLFDGSATIREYNWNTVDFQPVADDSTRYVLHFAFRLSGNINLNITSIDFDRFNTGRYHPIRLEIFGKSL